MNHYGLFTRSARGGAVGCCGYVCCGVFSGSRAPPYENYEAGAAEILNSLLDDCAAVPVIDGNNNEV